MHAIAQISQESGLNSSPAAANTAAASMRTARLPASAERSAAHRRRRSAATCGGTIDSISIGAL
jgi:hypothetical protein